MLTHLILQSSRKSEKNGRPRRRKRRLRARLTRSGRVSRPNSSEVQTTPPINQSTDNTCERPSGLRHQWVDHSCHPSDTRQTLEANPSPSTPSRVRQWREWHSTLQTLSCTATPITMGAVTHNRRTAKTTRCTNNVVPPPHKRSPIYSWPIRRATPLCAHVRVT
jgi:hypothetical protein